MLPTLLGEPPAAEGLPLRPDSVYLRLDGEGRLLEFAATPMGCCPAVERPQPADWSRIFELAGLNLADFQPVPPVRPPPLYADRLAAWESCPEGGKPCVVARGQRLPGEWFSFRQGRQMEAAEARRTARDSAFALADSLPANGPEPLGDLRRRFSRLA